MFNQTHAPVLLLLRIPSCGSAFRGSARAPLPASEGQNTQTPWGTRTRHRNGQGTGCSAGVNIAGRKAIGGVERPSLSIQYRRLLPESVSPLAPAAQSLPHSPYGKRLVPGHCLSKQPVCRRGREPGPPPPANEEQQNCSIAPCGATAPPLLGIWLNMATDPLASAETPLHAGLEEPCRVHGAVGHECGQDSCILPPPCGTTFPALRPRTFVHPRRVWGKGRISPSKSKSQVPSGTEPARVTKPAPSTESSEGILGDQTDQ